MKISYYYHTNARGIVTLCDFVPGTNDDAPPMLLAEIYWREKTLTLYIDQVYTWEDVQTDILAALGEKLEQEGVSQECLEFTKGVYPLPASALKRLQASRGLDQLPA